MKNDSTLASLIKKGILLTGCICIANRLCSRYAVRKGILKASPENYFDWKGVKVYYEKTGSGDPVILLHALHPAASSYEWHCIVDDLAKNHTVYLLDLPGCGRSGKPKVLYTSFYYVQLLRDFMSANSLQHATLIASNLSTPVALMTAAYDRSLVDKILLISPPSVSSLAETPDMRSKRKYQIMMLPIIGTLIYHIIASRPQIDLYFSEHYLYNPFHDSDDLVDAYYESAHIGNSDGHYFAASYLGKYLNMNISHVTKQLDIPIRILMGEKTERAEEILADWKELQRSMDCVIIPRTRQLPTLEEPGLVSAEIRSFLING